MKDLVKNILEEIEALIPEIASKNPHSISLVMKLTDELVRKIGYIDSSNVFPYSVVAEHQNSLSLKNNGDEEGEEKEIAFYTIIDISKDNLRSEIRLARQSKNEEYEDILNRAYSVIAKIEEHSMLVVQQRIMFDHLQKEALTSFNNLIDKKVSPLQQKINISEALIQGAEERMIILNENFTLIESSQNSITEVYTEIKDSQKTLLNEQKNISDNQKSTQKEFVTILGIFTTIIFAAFGGIQLLSGILTNISNSKLVVSIISGSFVFISIIIILSLLFSGLSKMANLSVRSCGCTDKKTCECKLSDKHPTIFYSFLLVLIVLPFALLSRYISFETLITNTIGVEKGINWSGIPRMLEVTFFALVPAIVFYTLDSKKIGPLIKFWTWPWIVSVSRGVKNRVLSWKWVRFFFKLDKSEKKSVVEENAAHTE